jgi:Fe-S-cluster containining protein
MSPSTPPEAGLAGVVPFRFACHRCGHCCSGGSGHVWVEEDEVERLARRVGSEREAFARTHLRTVNDPTSGRPRLALRERRSSGGGESGGACVLLEGANECTVYEDRPRHCGSFPHWPSVLETREGFERARAVCPGITPEVPAEVRARAFAALEALYERVDAIVENSGALCLRRGVCCRFEEAGHELWSTALEADYAASRTPEAPPPEAPGRCPYHVQGACTARASRALGCRTYHCDARVRDAMEEEYELLLAEVRAIERAHGYPAAYARFPDLLVARGVGRQAVDESQSSA